MFTLYRRFSIRVVFALVLSALLAFSSTPALSATPADTPIIPDGTLDVTFNTQGTGFGKDNLSAPQIRDSLELSDGKIMIVGDFDTYNGVAAPGIIRLNPDGTRDMTFSVVSGTGVSTGPYSIAVQSDGKYLLAGAFSEFNGISNQAITRLNSDGTVDEAFTSPIPPYADPQAPVPNPNPYAQRVIVVTDRDEDGVLTHESIVLVGAISKATDSTTDPDNPAVVSVGRVVHLSLDGTLDTEFNNNLRAGANSTVTHVKAFPNRNFTNEGIIIGGGFTTVGDDGDGNVYSRRGVARIASNGVVKGGFEPATDIRPAGYLGSIAATFSTSSIDVDADGKILLAGASTHLGSATPQLLRLNKSDGSLDSTFNSGGAGFTTSATPARVYGVAVAADGTIYATGPLATYNGVAVSNFVRLTSSGLLDTTFDAVGTTAELIETYPRVLSSGRVLLTGRFFSSYQGTAVTAFAVITNAESLIPPTKTVQFNPNGGTGTLADQVASGIAALTLNTLTKPGYAFAGWTTNQDGTGDSYADGADFDFSVNQELFAKWTATDTAAPVLTGPASVTVTTPATTVATYTANEAVTTWALSGTDSALFDIDGGVVTFKTASVAGTYSINVLATDAYGNTATTAVTVTASAAVVPVANKTVSFSGNGGVGPKYTFKANKSVKLPANKFTRKGFVFAGWNTKADGSGTSYKNQVTFPFTANATLYAQWKAVAKSSKRIAIFKGDDAALSNDMKYTIRTWINKLPAGASVTCEGSTSGLKVTSFDKSLANSRAKNVCEYAKTIKKGLKYTLTTNPSSANDMQARHVWIRSN